MKNGHQDEEYVVLTTDFRICLPRFVSLSLLPAESWALPKSLFFCTIFLGYTLPRNLRAGVQNLVHRVLVLGWLLTAIATVLRRVACPPASRFVSCLSPLLFLLVR